MESESKAEAERVAERSNINEESWEGVSLKGRRMAENISCWLSHDRSIDLKTSDARLIAKWLDKEYGTTSADQELEQERIKRRLLEDKYRNLLTVNRRMLEAVKDQDYDT